MSASKQYCTFFLDGKMFGIEVVHVQEVLRYQEMTEVPLAPAVVRGLLNLRGNIVSSIDTRRLLGLAPLGSDQRPGNVVIQTANGMASLLVDQIGEVVEVTEDQFEPAPDTIDAETRRLLAGVYKLSGNLLLALNLDQVMELDCALT